MLPKQRQIKIIDRLRQVGEVSVEQLVVLFKVSAETIRRDLSLLAEAGKIRKVHGGAVLSRKINESPFNERMAENPSAKRLIARAASSLVQTGDTIFIDTGSTSLIFAEELVGVDELTVITNSAAIAETISDHKNGAQVYLIGGKYNDDNHETFGTLAIAQLRQFRAQRAVITIGALDAKAGATDYSIEEAQIAQTMIEHSESLMMLCDSSKFGSVASYQVCGLSDIDQLICDSIPEGALSNALARQKLEVICPQQQEFLRGVN